MSRILLLILFLIWMTWTPSETYAQVRWSDIGIFLGGYAALILILGLWSRLLARRVALNNLHRSMRRFTRWLSMGRCLIPLWFTIGVTSLGWKTLVMHLFGSAHPPVELPYAVMGLFPAFAAWVGLWWAQYPADRSLREQSMLIQLDQNLPIHAPPGFWSYLNSNFRLQLLFTVAPIFAIMILRDCVALICWMADVKLGEGIEFWISLSAAGAIFIFAPLFLKRILHTEPLMDPVLRTKLEGICRRYRLKYRDILLWKTQNNMGNAAVMGLFPQVRYILMSDLLLETMTDEQIEAVFAHEVGHIVHRHLIWYVVFVLTLMLAIAGPGAAVYDWITAMIWPAAAAVKDETVSHPWLDMTLMGACAAFFFTVFGFLSRRFERQADVFAAREMEKHAISQESRSSLVGGYGASIFSSALLRVAAINNIPVSSRKWNGGSLLQFFSFFFDRALDSANNWLHGSITYRTDFLEKLALDPPRVLRFDKLMFRIYALMLIAFVLVGLFAFKQLSV